MKSGIAGKPTRLVGNVTSPSASPFDTFIQNRKWISGLSCKHNSDAHFDETACPKTNSLLIKCYPVCSSVRAANAFTIIMHTPMRCYRWCDKQRAHARIITTVLASIFQLSMLSAWLVVRTISSASPCGHWATSQKLLGRFLYVIGTDWLYTYM